MVRTMRASACRKSPPARSSCGRSRRNKIESVISGGVYVGNDTSHARRDDFSVWNRVPPGVLTFSTKRLVNFDKLTSRFVDRHFLHIPAQAGFHGPGQGMTEKKADQIRSSARPRASAP